MLYDVKFNDLFDSKKQAVTCYLSLERRYQELCKQFKEQKKETNQIISLGYMNYIKSKPPVCTEFEEEAI